MLARRLLVLVGLSTGIAGIAHADGLPGPVGGSVVVPLDHGAPDGPSASLAYELGANFDATKPTVFVITDAQQFHVRPGAMPALQASLFGDGFNVVGIMGRGSNPAFVRHVRDAQGQPDWQAAWRIFRSAQWVEDIEAVRRRLLGETGKALLYGRSGGALLVHEYLAAHGDKVARAWTQAPPVPTLAAELGLQVDHFWEEIGAHDPSLQPLLRRVLSDHPTQRADWLRILQRQNFFVPLDQRDQERARLIRAMAANDLAVLAAARKAYQVEAIERLLASLEGMAITVRLYELQASTAPAPAQAGDGIHPGRETFLEQVRPLISLRERGRIAAPVFDSARLRRVEAEVLVLAGRHDHTADYRVLIALAAHYPRGRLFIADDNHVFEAMNRQGHVTALMRAFLTEGMDSAAYRTAEATAGVLRWRE